LSFGKYDGVKVSQVTPQVKQIRINGNGC
jgi:hypothetical protein